jgi:hypothetical protein
MRKTYWYYVALIDNGYARFEKDGYIETTKRRFLQKIADSQIRKYERENKHCFDFEDSTISYFYYFNITKETREYAKMLELPVPVKLKIAS